MTDFSHLVREANLIAGRWVPADDGGQIDVTDPATGDVVARVPDAGAGETRRAIEAAHAAFPAYAALPLGERVALMRRLHQAILNEQEALAAMLTAEQGKPLAESRLEIASSAAYVLWFAEEARRAYGGIVPSPVPGRRLMTTRHAVGVVAAITPWNFPSSMLARKLGPALATGCTVVVKPASATPLSGLVWGLLAERCGFPPGVVNVVTGSARAIGGEITTNSKVRKITFTGSTAIGKELIRQAAGTVKRVSYGARRQCPIPGL
jgi:succinate-semialdehyde dehydrogenase/glutarate-semialdehyde dehydrogenase